MATSRQVTEAQSCKCTPRNPGNLPKKIYNAAEEGKISEITEWLKTPSVDVNSASLLNRTVLHFACLEDQPKVIEVMMMKNVCLNTKDNAGETPLIIASKKGHKSCVELLLKSKSSSRGGCIVDVDVLTKYSEKTALNLAQEELERADKEKNFQDIVYMLRKRANLYASTNSITQTRDSVNEEPIMGEPRRNRVLETENSNLLADASVKNSLVMRIRDGIQEKSKLLFNQSKSFFLTHCSLLLDLSPWVMQLLLVMITLYLVTGYRSNVGFALPCNTNHSTNHNISVMGSLAYPLNLNTIQHVARGCDNSNKILILSGDFSPELYFVAVVASMTTATLVWIIVYHSNIKYEGMNILYVDLPVLFFNSFFWLCASCDLAVAITKLKGVLDFDTFRNRNAHFCDNISSCNIKDINVTVPYTVPLEFGCFFGFVIFFSSILYLLKLVIQYKRYHN